MKQYKNRTVKVLIRTTQEGKKKLDRIAKHKGISRTELINRYIDNSYKQIREQGNE